MTRLQHHLCIIALIVIMSAILTVPAAANGGLSVEPGVIRAEVPISAGETHVLPQHRITNHGGKDCLVTVEVSDRQHETRTLVPAEWLTIEPDQLVVTADSTGTVQVTLTTPVNAQPGDYAVWLMFMAQPEGSGVVVGHAVGVGLAFTIAATDHENIEPVAVAEPEPEPAQNEPVTDEQPQQPDTTPADPEQPDTQETTEQQPEPSGSSQQPASENESGHLPIQPPTYSFPYAAVGAGLLVIGLGWWLLLQRQQAKEK